MSASEHRPADEAETGRRALAMFARQEMDRAELRAFVAAVSAVKGRRLKLPDDYTAWNKAEEFILTNIDEPTAAMYVKELETRLKTGSPLVRRALLPRGQRRTREPPRNADEFIERRSKDASQRFWKEHESGRRSPRYAKLKEQRLQVAEHRCEKCGSKSRLQLHHLHYETLKHERVADVQILCDGCHAAATKRQRAVRRARWRGGHWIRGPKLFG